jgi:hypothetical protein
MLTLLSAEMKQSDDPIPLVVDNPKPAAWAPPDKEDSKKAKQKRNKKTTP